MPKLLKVRNEEYCFSQEAFRAWAESIENGKLDGMKPEDFDDGWWVHVSSICNMATNESCSSSFFRRAMELNLDLAFLDDVIRLYERGGGVYGQGIWHDTGQGRSLHIVNYSYDNDSHRIRNLPVLRFRLEKPWTLGHVSAFPENPQLEVSCRQQTLEVKNAGIYTVIVFKDA